MSAEPARILAIIMPGGMQGYFEQIGPLLFGSPDLDEINRIDAAYWGEITGPPLT